MPEGMGGPHQFDLSVKSNDKLEPEQVLTILAQFPLR